LREESRKLVIALRDAQTAQGNSNLLAETTYKKVKRTWPRSHNWDYYPTESKLHFKRVAGASDPDDWVEAMKKMWIELGIFNCARDMGSRTGYSQPASILTFLNYGSWTRFDQGDFVGVDSTLKDANGDSQEWIFKETEWSSIGYAFIPNVCLEYWDKDKGTPDQQPCHVHISFSPSGNRGEFVQKFALTTQFPLVAASNNMILIYPSSTDWNYKGEIDATKWDTVDGLYPKTLSAMICRLISPNEYS